MTKQQREAMRLALERLRKYHHGNGFAEDAECIADLEAALAQQAEPEPEPVAWMDRFGSVVVGKGPYETFTTPLYTTPPARRPLTDAEIDTLWRKFASEEGFTTAQFVRNFARTIERKITGGQQ